MQVEVFRTSVATKHQARALMEELTQNLPSCTISFDLEDCDKVLRIEAMEIEPPVVMKILKSRGFECEVLS